VLAALADVPRTDPRSARADAGRAEQAARVMTCPRCSKSIRPGGGIRLTTGETVHVRCLARDSKSRPVGLKAETQALGGAQAADRRGEPRSAGFAQGGCMRRMILIIGMITVLSVALAPATSADTTAREWMQWDATGMV